jgi:hypothetical protein
VKKNKACLRAGRKNPPRGVGKSVDSPITDSTLERVPLTDCAVERALGFSSKQKLHYRWMIRELTKLSRQQFLDGKQGMDPFSIRKASAVFAAGVLKLNAQILTTK